MKRRASPSAEARSISRGARMPSAFSRIFKRPRTPWPMLPAMTWQIAFLVGPLVLVAGYAFSIKGTYGGVVPGWTLENLTRVFDPLYLHIYARSLELATITMFGCLLVGYPV